MGSETLQVRISDGFGGSTVATVTLHNAAPSAGADSFQVGATGAVLEVLSNDTDADQDALVIAAVSEAAGGTLSHDGQRITYTPGAGFRGYDQFSYTVSDQHGGSAVGSVTVMADYSVAQTLAMQDEAAPGSEGAVWARFGAPSIFEQGREAGWLATIKAGKKQAQGIYSGPIGAPVLRVQAGDRARDAAGPRSRARSRRRWWSRRPGRAWRSWSAGRVGDGAVAGRARRRPRPHRPGEAQHGPRPAPDQTRR